MAKAFQLLTVLKTGSTVEVPLLRFSEARGGELGCRYATPSKYFSFSLKNGVSFGHLDLFFLVFFLSHSSIQA